MEEKGEVEGKSGMGRGRKRREKEKGEAIRQNLGSEMKNYRGAWRH